MARGLVLCLLLAAGEARLAPASTQLHKPAALSKVSTGGATKKRPASEQLTPSETVLAGACARLVAQTILHPLDVIRTRSQTKNPIEATLLEALPFGLAPQMLLSVPAGSIQFAMVKYWRTQIEAAFGDRCTSTAAGRFFTQLFAAAGGAACAGSVRIPQEVVKQGCMAEMYPNAIKAVETISQEKGVAGFYKGAVATISRDVAWNSLSFALFRVFLEAFAVQSAQLNYALGIVAGCLAACATHPIDVIKTRIMTSSGDAASVGIVEGLRNLVDEEGPGVLLSGLVPRLLYLGPLASLVLATNEVIASILIAGRK